MHLTPLCTLVHNELMEWEVEFTDEFLIWWSDLGAEEQDSVNFGVRLLQEHGPNLKRPHADTLEGSSFPNMRELRIQHEGRPYRVLYAFDPRRIGILLLGGDKTGNARWYIEYIPKADAIYRQHLRELEDDKR
jgi:hypothetical protein